MTVFEILSSNLRPLLQGRGAVISLLLIVNFTASLSEGIGFALVIPILGTMFGNGADEAALGSIGTALAWVANLFPQDWRLLGLLGLLTFLFLFKSIALVASGGIARWFINSLRMEWVKKAFLSFMSAPFSSVAGRPQGIVVQTIIGETDSGAKAILLLIEFVARAIQVIVLFAILLLTSWQTTLIAMALGAVVFIAIWRRTQHFALGTGKKRVKIREQINDTVSESIIGLRAIKLLGMAAPRADMLHRKLAEYRRIDTVFEITSSLPSNVIDLVAILLGSAVIALLTIGLGIDIVAVLPMTALFSLVFMRLASASAYLFSRRMQIMAALPSLQSVKTLVSEKGEQEPGGVPFPGFTSEICFENVHLRPPGRMPLFQDLSLRLPERGLTAIVGPSGAGKTTLVDLLVRLREPDEGRILVGGCDIRTFDVASLRARVGYLTQEPLLFNGTVRENLCFGRPDATQDMIEDATRRAHAHDFISAMPHGYDTAVGRGAATLSGGQKQRLALARELLRAPDLYIFDEPTSALDHEAEAAISELMRDLSKTHPVIVIAHRLGTIEGAQVIYRIEHGKAKALTFAELTASQSSAT